MFETNNTTHSLSCWHLDKQCVPRYLKLNVLHLNFLHWGQYSGTDQNGILEMPVFDLRLLISLFSQYERVH